MQNIVINEEYLKKLYKEYVAQVDALEAMPGHEYKYGELEKSEVDIELPFRLQLGGSQFEEAVTAANRLDEIRTGLVNRVKSACKELRDLEYGVEYLLEDSQAVEEVSTLSAEQFEYFIPKGS